MPNSRDAFARDIAAKAFHLELAHARALGYSPVGAITSACDVMDESYNRCFAEDRPLVTLGLRKVGARDFIR